MKRKLEFVFWPMRLQLIPWLHYFAIGIFIVRFCEGAGGWALFGITINDFRGFFAERTALTITLFGHNFRFGVKTKLEVNNG